jgi:ATP-binding cassette subfamily B protein
MPPIEFEEEEFSTQFNGQTLLRILGFIRPSWRMVIGFLISVAIVAGIDSFLTYLGKQIIDVGILSRDNAALRSILTHYGLMVLIQILFVFGFIYFAGIVAERVQYDLRKVAFDHLQELSLAYYDRTPVGWIMSRLTSDTERISQLVSWGMLDVTWGLFNILTSIYFMLLINSQLTVIVIALIPILWFVAAEFKKRILVQFRLVRKVNSKITGAYNENITGVRVVKALTRESTNLDEFSQLTDEMYHSSFRAAKLSALFFPTVQIISSIAVGLIAYYGGVQTQIGTMTVGGIQAFVSYVTFMLWPIQEMARVYAELQHAIASAERVFSMIDSVPEIRNLPQASDPLDIKGEIEFDQVDFYYEEDKPVLKDFSLKVNAGESIALVGPTGGGKSTIVNLVSRFYEPRQGRILISGQDYTQFTLEGIQSRIGIVLQTPHLFSGTIRENIRYGRLNATNEQIETAARIAGAHEFIKELDKGYDEEVGEGGILLSVGQKQLVSLARAVLSDPDIFIMDEATSSVDTLTEHLIQEGLEKILVGRTSFIIAHRLSTIKRADRIVVIEDGQIVESGSHRQLLKDGGKYHRLYTQQFRRQLDTTFDALTEAPAAAD